MSLFCVYGSLVDVYSSLFYVHVCLCSCMLIYKGLFYICMGLFIDQFLIYTVGLFYGCTCVSITCVWISFLCIRVPCLIFVYIRPGYISIGLFYICMGFFLNECCLHIRWDSFTYAFQWDHGIMRYWDHEIKI